MKLLDKETYKKVEKFLYNYKEDKNDFTKNKVYNEIITFFSVSSLYTEFLNIFYLNRFDFKNRYPTNSSLFLYLKTKLYIEEPTLYVVRKDIIYKSAMILYKYNFLN